MKRVFRWFLNQNKKTIPFLNGNLCTSDFLKKALIFMDASFYFNGNLAYGKHQSFPVKLRDFVIIKVENLNI